MDCVRNHFGVRSTNTNPSHFPALQFSRMYVAENYMIQNENRLALQKKASI
jgi:hypothetical protein